MKRLKDNIAYIISGLLFIFIVGSCSDKSSEVAPVFNKVTPIKDMSTSLSSGSMGDWIAISGAHLNSVDSVMFNDVSVLPKDFYSEDSVLYLQVPVKIPKQVNDKLTLKSKGGDISYGFKVNIPNLQLTGMFCEYTQPGDTIKIYGKYLQLYEVNSSNSTVKFGDKETPVIKSTDTYITAKVPADAPSNAQVSIHNSKYNVDAICSGRYRDNKWMIADYDGVGDNSSSFIVQDQHNKKQRPYPISGNFLRLLADATHPVDFGWLYITSNDFNYTDDMEQHPDKYVLKFELNMGYPIKSTKFYIYFYWNHAPDPIGNECFTVQTYGTWQTISIPFEKILPVGATDASSAGSLNIRVESNENVDMSFDNFRLSEK